MIWLSVLFFAFIPAILIVQCEPKKSKETAKIAGKHSKPKKSPAAQKTKLERTTRFSVKDEDDPFEFHFDDDMVPVNKWCRNEPDMDELSERTCKSTGAQDKSVQIEPTQGTESQAQSKRKAGGLRKNKDLDELLDATQRSVQLSAKSPATPPVAGKSPGTPKE